MYTLRAMREAAFGLLIAVLAMAPTLAMAGSGSASVPHWRGQSSGALNRVQTAVYVSNISTRNINITMTFLGLAGDIVLDGDGSTATGVFRATNADLNYSESPNNASVSFTLPPRNTAVITINPVIADMGHAIIEWNKTASIDPVALVGHAVVDTFDTSNGAFHSQSVTVNNGKPF